MKRILCVTLALFSSWHSLSTLMLALAAALFLEPVWADVATVKGVRWVYEESNGQVTIGGDPGFNYKGKERTLTRFAPSVSVR